MNTDPSKRKARRRTSEEDVSPVAQVPEEMRLQVMVHDAYNAMWRLMKYVSSEHVDRNHPDLFEVYDDGNRYGPFTEAEVEPWSDGPFDVLFDTTKNQIVLRDDLDNAARTIPIPHVKSSVGLVSPILGLLRIFAERPGRRLQSWTISRYAGIRLSADTFKQYVKRLRKMLGDDHQPYQLIQTDLCVDHTVSKTGSAYYANPSLHWRVIRYVDPSPKNTPSR